MYIEIQNECTIEKINKAKNFVFGINETDKPLEKGKEKKKKEIRHRLPSQMGERLSSHLILGSYLGLSCTI